jgi:prepilin-type N-terminal cleavage/methylation domain-containing protein
MKKGFSLIELIFSIIILSLIIGAFLYVSNNSIETGRNFIKEETVNNEAVLISIIARYSFDENNTQGKDNIYKVLKAVNGDSKLKRAKNGSETGLARIGKAEFNNNIFRSLSNNQVSNIGVDAGENKDDSSTFDDTDDFNGYKKDINGHQLSVEVYYIKDNADYDNENVVFNIDENTKANHTNIK